MAVTTVTIATALGRDPVSEVEVTQWEMWIVDAMMLIESRLGDPVLLDQAVLDYVIREAVVSHIKHPDDATNVSVSVDDANVSRTYRTGRGRVTIIEEWWDLLAPTGRSGAFSIDTIGLLSIHLAWCSLAFLANYCSCGADIAGYPIYELD